MKRETSLAVVTGIKGQSAAFCITVQAARSTPTQNQRKQSSNNVPIGAFRRRYGGGGVLAVWIYLGFRGFGGQFQSYSATFGVAYSVRIAEKAKKTPLLNALSIGIYDSVAFRRL